MSIDIRVQKTTPILPRVRDAPKRSWHKEVYCRRCGSGILEAHWNYCPNCGQAVMHYSYAGTQGWDHRRAEEVYRRLTAGLDTTEMEGADDNSGNALRDPRASG